ncbi:unnamed protein product [Rangifer tarandus platyrhynchus]|uniref:Uncharacterized protein n=1 Tax=Rangifer tarandus platyrhynchus TaxID=3082113 RepID=A0AC59YBU5_RANTA
MSWACSELTTLELASMNHIVWESNFSNHPKETQATDQHWSKPAGSLNLKSKAVNEVVVWEFASAPLGSPTIPALNCASLKGLQTPKALPKDAGTKF